MYETALINDMRLTTSNLRELMKKISLKSKTCLTIATGIIFSSFLIQSMIVFGFINSTHSYDIFSYVCTILFVFPFMLFVDDFLEIVSSSEKDLLEEVMIKNTYLEHAAKILRHDMHSGINTYLPRGVKSLKRRLSEDNIKQFKLEAPLRLISEGLEHSQQVYKGIYEFTNLVREGSELSRGQTDISRSLKSYLKRTSYSDQVRIGVLPTLHVNEPLFCTAVDNLIRNGLKYNDSKTKFVSIQSEDNNVITITDNGRGISQEEFNKLSVPYCRKKNQKEKGSGLGLNICVAIIKEHGYSLEVEKLQLGTTIRIKTNDQLYTACR